MYSPLPHSNKQKKTRSSTEAPLSSLPSLTPAAATAALASSLARLAGESVPPTAWACVGVDPTARHAVYRVDAR